MKEPFLPKAFVEKFSRLFGGEAEEFFKYCKTKSPRTIRANSFKTTPEKLKALLEKRGLELEKHAAFENVFVLKTANVSFARIPEHRKGLFVVQDVSSMVPARVLSPKPGSLVLDLAAAPGTKTTQMAELMKNTGAIVAVDINAERLKGLRFNLNVFGAINVVVVNFDSRFFRPNLLFDFVLLDAPCSSEGVVRKRFDALDNWSQALVERKARLQKQLVIRAFSLLRDGGKMVYSTCSLSPEENEEVVDFLLKNNSNAAVEKVKLEKLKFRSGFTEYNGKRFDASIANCLRVMPQDNNSEAFFVAKIGKGKP